MAGVAVTQHRPVVFVHIGAMKTGTTYLQQLMAANQEALADAGFCFPGEDWGDQVRAAHDALGHHRDRAMRARAAGAWDRLATQMLAYDGVASVFSVEFLSFAGRRGVQRVVSRLAGAEVHVVLTVRDTAGVLPGLWQTHCANGGTVSWPAFADSVRRAAAAPPVAPLLGQGARLFRRALDVPRMLEHWGAVVPPERLHVVTVPPAGSPRDLLWERFAGVIGVDPAVASAPARTHNPSLGYASADLMRRINAELGRLPRADYNPTLKHHLAEKVLAARASDEARARLDASGTDLALRWNRRIRAALEASGAHVVGDLADLPTSTTDLATSERRAPGPEPDTADLLDAATTALLGLQRLVDRRTRRLHGDTPPHREATDHASTVRAAAWRAAPDPVASAVSDLANECRAAIGLHQHLRRRSAHAHGEPRHG